MFNFSNRFKNGHSQNGEIKLESYLIIHKYFKKTISTTINYSHKEFIVNLFYLQIYLFHKLHYSQVKMDS